MRQTRLASWRRAALQPVARMQRQVQYQANSCAANHLGPTARPPSQREISSDNALHAIHAARSQACRRTEEDLAAVARSPVWMRI